jgi:hypothetical protein
MLLPLLSLLGLGGSAVAAATYTPVLHYHTLEGPSKKLHTLEGAIVQLHSLEGPTKKLHELTGQD